MTGEGWQHGAVSTPYANLYIPFSVLLLVCGQLGAAQACLCGGHPSRSFYGGLPRAALLNESLKGRAGHWPEISLKAVDAEMKTRATALLEKVRRVPFLSIRDDGSWEHTLLPPQRRGR